MKKFPHLVTCASILLAVACGGGEEPTAGGNAGGAKKPATPATQPAAQNSGADHSHDEVSIGTALIGDLTVELSQGHGAVAPGKTCHLVVKLPYSDQGASVIRAWIGTADRQRSMVSKADYAAGHDDYDLHTTAPAPLPAGSMWWIEIQKPDGSKLLGSAKPLF